MLQIMLTRFEVWSTMILLVSRHHWFMCHPINIWRHILRGWWILWNLLVRIPQRWLNKCDSSQEQPLLFEDVVRTVGVRFQSFCHNSCLIMWNINENQFQWKSKRTYGSYAHLGIILINKQYAAWRHGHLGFAVMYTNMKLCFAIVCV